MLAPIKNYSLIAIGVLIIVLLSTSIFYYKANNSNLVKNGNLQTNNEILKQNEKYFESSSAITDTVVKDFVTETTRANIAVEQLRKQSIDEYIQNSETFREGDIRKELDSPNDQRITNIANRLLKNYCRIRPEDPDCHSVNTDNGMSNR